jgi:hypothetical protein
MGLSIGHGIGIPFKKNSISWSSYCTPLNLILTEITGGIKLTWQENSPENIDGYEIWVSIGGNTYVLLNTVSANVLTYDDMTDYSGYTVEYKVRAFKETTYSEYIENEISIPALIQNLAVNFVDDFVRLTFNGESGWQTELYESYDNTNWTLVATIDAGVNSYDRYTWMGRRIYFRCRAKKGSEFGDYCESVNIQTPLVFKFDCNPTNLLSFSPFNLPANKTVRVYWGSFFNGVEYYSEYITTQTPSRAYNNQGEGNQDPCYVKITGDIDSITQIIIISDVKKYGDLSRWYLPSLISLTKLYLFSCGFTGDLTNWAYTLPSTLTDLRIYKNHFTGDLSNLIFNTSAPTIAYFEDTDEYNEFTAPPKGTLHQCEGATAGLYMRHCSISTATLDAWFTWFNNYLATHTPVRNTYIMFIGTGNGIPTGGNSNTDIVGIKAKYTAAGFTCNININT